MPERLPKDIEDWLQKLATADYRGNRPQESEDAERFLAKYAPNGTKAPREEVRVRQFCRCSHSKDIHLTFDNHACRVPGCGCKEFRP